MFGWFRKPLIPVDAYIFTYYNGKRWVKGDGLQIMRDLALQEGLDDISLKTAETPTINGVMALSQVIAAVRVAFKLKHVKDGGVTDGRAKEIYLEFWKWYDTVKKNSSSSPILPDGQDFQEDLLPEQSLLSSMPTDTDPMRDLPTQSPAESDLPLENAPTG